MSERNDLTGMTLQLDHKYRVGTALHRGPMATLYSAEWELFDLPVYVRSYESLVKLRLRHRDTTRIRWAIESEAGKVRGPNLPDVVDAGIEDPTRPFLVMRLPKGNLLLNLVADRGRLPANQVVGVVAGVARALTHCRDVGIVHRGPTVDRVWLGADGEVVLLGLGEVLYRDDTVSMSGPPSTELLWHIPPESFTVSLRRDDGGEDESVTMRLRTRAQGTLQGRTLEDDPRAEVYSLGCLAYHALNGHHPFFTSVDDPTEGIHATIRDTPLELRDFDLHSEVWRVISQAIAREPSERFASPVEFAEALSDAINITAPTTSEVAVSADDEEDFDDFFIATGTPPAVQDAPAPADAFQLWAWRFTSLVLFGIVAVLLLHERFEGQTLLVLSDPPGIQIGEEIGHTREPLGPTPVLLFGRDAATPLKLFAIGPDGSYGATGTYDVGRFQDLGRCRATELLLQYPETTPAAEGSGPE